MLTHLHCHSFYSFSAGTMRATELPKYAAEAGMSSLALTDTNNLSGAIEFYQAAIEAGVRWFSFKKLSREASPGHVYQL